MGNKQAKKQQNLSHPGFKNYQQNGLKTVFLNLQITEGTINWIGKTQSFIKNQDFQETPLLFPKIQETISENYCGTQKSYKLIYPYFQFNLKDQIANRKLNQESFTEIELWYLFYQLLLGSVVFQKRRMKSGDIRPANILLNEEGQLKLVNQFSFPNQKPNYFKSLKEFLPTFLAPEQLWQLQQQLIYQKSDPSLGESFSIGLTLMDAANLQNSEQLYDAKKVRFQMEMFEGKITTLKTNKYSPFFVKTVMNMIAAQTVDRLSPAEALAVLRPYQQYILNLQQFVPDRAKSKQSLQAYHSMKH